MSIYKKEKCEIYFTKILKCDWCGMKSINENRWLPDDENCFSIQRTNITYSLRNAMAGQFRNREVKCDLCPNCMNKLLKWLAEQGANIFTCEERTEYEQKQYMKKHD